MDSDSSLRTALKRVAVVLKEAGIPFALAGSYASWARGGPEPNHDVDFVIAKQDVDHALHRLTEAGMRVEDPPEDWLVKVFCADEMVDLIFEPVGRTVTHEMLAEADEFDVDSVTMPVIDATSLLVTKLLAMTDHYCDFSTVLPHARALREQIDWDRLRRDTADSAFAAAFVVLAERLGIITTSEAAAAPSA